VCVNVRFEEGDEKTCTHSFPLFFPQRPTETSYLNCWCVNITVRWHDSDFPECSQRNMHAANLCVDYTHPGIFLTHILARARR
jgi:hypothetical protein